MSKKAVAVVTSVCLLMIAALGGLLVAKKMKARSARQIEASLVMPVNFPAGADTAELVRKEKAVFLDHETVGAVIEKEGFHLLWSMSKAEAATRINERFSLKLQEGENPGLKVSYRDENEKTASLVLKSLLESYASIKTAKTRR